MHGREKGEGEGKAGAEDCHQGRPSESAFPVVNMWGAEHRCDSARRRMALQSTRNAFSAALSVSSIPAHGGAKGEGEGEAKSGRLRSRMSSQRCVPCCRTGYFFHLSLT